MIEKTKTVEKGRETVFFHHPLKITESIGKLKVEIFHNDVSDESSRQDWQTGWHFHSLLEVIFLTKGSATVSTDVGSYSFKAGEIMIIPAKLNHKSFSNENYQERFSILLGMSSKQDENVPQPLESKIYSSFDKLNRASHPIRIEGGEGLFQSIDSIIGLYENEGVIKKRIWKYHLLILVLNMLDSLDNRATETFFEEEAAALDETVYESSEARNQMIEQYFYENDCKNVSIKGLAGAIHLSERQTSRILSEDFGATFKQIVNQARIRTAQSYLLDGTPISVTSESVGFQSINGFNKAFKSVTGITPFQFTKEHKDEIIRNAAAKAKAKKEQSI